MTEFFLIYIFEDNFFCLCISYVSNQLVLSLLSVHSLCSAVYRYIDYIDIFISIYCLAETDLVVLYLEFKTSYLLLTVLQLKTLGNE